MHTIAVAALTAAAGCSGVGVSTDFDSAVDFSEFNTYSWMQMPPGVGQDTDALMAARIKKAIDSRLSDNGLEKTSDDPDLLVVYHTGKQSQIKINAWGYGYWEQDSADLPAYEVGTLIVDLVNASTHKLVWRGSAKDALPDTPSARERTERVNAAVAEIFNDFPPSK